jgi:hypothetical protein
MSIPPSFSLGPTTLSTVSPSLSTSPTTPMHLPPLHKTTFEVNDSDKQSRKDGIDSSKNMATPLSSRSRPTATRQVKSDERHNRTKRPAQSYGSPISHRKRRALEAQSTSSARSATDDGYPTLQNLCDKPSLPEDGNTPASEVSRLEFTSKTPQEVHEEVRRRLSKDVSKLNNSGFVYVVRHPEHPHLLKIGSSLNTGKRRKQIHYECGIAVQEVFVSDEVDRCLRAEFLAQSDVWHLCRPHDCVRCGKHHTEWHEIGEDLAIDVVKRWVNFMQQRPYTSAGKLKSIWKHLLNRRRLSNPENGSFSHETRWQHWKSVLSPPRQIDYYEHFCETWLPLLWTFSWQISTVFSWTVLFLSFRSITSLFFLFLSVLCSSVHLSSSRLFQRGKK